MARSYESPRRVVITGVGIVSPLGIGFDVFTANLLAGKSSITQLESTPYSGSPHNVGAEIKDFNETTAKNEYLKKQRKSIKVMCREIQFGVASASLAIDDSGLDLAAIDHDRFGVDFGANLMFSPPAVLKDAAWTCVGRRRSDLHLPVRAMGRQGTAEPRTAVAVAVPAQHAGLPYRNLRRRPRPQQLDHAERGVGKPGRCRGLSRHSARPGRHHDRRNHGDENSRGQVDARRFVGHSGRTRQRSARRAGRGLSRSRAREKSSRRAPAR